MDRYRKWKIAREGSELGKLIKANPDKPWNWSGISSNPNITLDIIKANSDKPWDWSGISYNPNITLDFIKANPDKPWNWSEISQNKFIYNNHVCQRLMKKDIAIKRNFIIGGTGMVIDLAKIVAGYCSYL